MGKKKQFAIFTLARDDMALPPEKIALPVDWVAPVKQMGNTDTTEIKTKGGEVYTVMGTFETVMEELEQ